MKTKKFALLFFLSFAFIAVSINGCAKSYIQKPIIAPQGEVIPFDSDKWSFIGGTKTEDYLGQKALVLGVKKEGKAVGFGLAMLKDTKFTNGIIEYDVHMKETRTFAGLRLRAQKGPNFENFYMRGHHSGDPDANQYMPVYNNIPSWQLYYGESYSAPTKYDFNQWMHIKVVVSGKLADFYIVDMEKPAFTAELKREEQTGKIGLWGLNLKGQVWFANFAVKAMDNPEIKGTPKPEPVAKSGSILTWDVSNTFDGKSLDGKTILTKKEKHGLVYKKLKSEKSGLTNLAVLQGIKKGKDTVFARVVISSKSDQVKKMNFGFSDKVKIYLNNQILCEASDEFSSRDYRFLGTVGFYDAVFLPLKKGDNEVLFAVSEDVEDRTGWAVKARFEDMKGISIK